MSHQSRELNLSLVRGHYEGLKVGLEPLLTMAMGLKHIQASFFPVSRPSFPCTFPESYHHPMGFWWSASPWTGSNFFLSCPLLIRLHRHRFSIQHLTQKYLPLSCVFSSVGHHSSSILDQNIFHSLPLSVPLNMMFSYTSPFLLRTIKVSFIL